MTDTDLAGGIMPERRKGMEGACGKEINNIGRTRMRMKLNSRGERQANIITEGESENEERRQRNY